MISIEIFYSVLSMVLPKPYEVNGKLSLVSISLESSWGASWGIIPQESRDLDWVPLP